MSTAKIYAVGVADRIANKPLFYPVSSISRLSTKLLPYLSLKFYSPNLCFNLSIARAHVNNHVNITNTFNKKIQPIKPPPVVSH